MAALRARIAVAIAASASFFCAVGASASARAAALRLPADVVHQDGDIGAFDGLQRRGHGEIHVLSISPYHVRTDPARPHGRPDSEVRNEQAAKTAGTSNPTALVAALPGDM